MLLIIKYVFILSTAFARNISRYKKNWTRDDQKRTHVFM